MFSNLHEKENQKYSAIKEWSIRLCLWYVCITHFSVIWETSCNIPIIPKILFAYSRTTTCSINVKYPISWTLHLIIFACMIHTQFCCVHNNFLNLTKYLILSLTIQAWGCLENYWQFYWSQLNKLKNFPNHQILCAPHVP